VGERNLKMVFTLVYLLFCCLYKYSVIESNEKFLRSEETESPGQKPELAVRQDGTLGSSPEEPIRLPVGRNLNARPSSAGSDPAQIALIAEREAVHNGSM
jgi:hypothetical protein